MFGTGVDAGQTTIPPASRLRRAGSLRRRPDLEPVHGHRRVPQLGRVLGTERHGVLSQCPGALDADSRRHATHVRARASGRLGRPGQLCRPHRAAEHRRRIFPIPTCPASFASAATGATSRSRASCATSSGRTQLADQFDLSGDEMGWGVNLSSNIKLGNSTLRLAGRVRRGHPELYERCAGGRRHP